jgi:hypothetical protein
MNALVIKDLPVTVEMDRTAMTALSGGRSPQQIMNIIQAVSDFANDAPVQRSFTGSGATTTY